jgi:hypothetical protein
LSEETIWNQLLFKLNEYPEKPIYHYGSYELKAFRELAKKYNIDIQKFEVRLTNITSCVYGKVYFPVSSNSLKEIDLFMNASWASPVLSGIQSIVWRYRWESTRNKRYKEELLSYNNGDCKVLKVLTDKISEIISQDHASIDIDFADQKSRLSTETGEEIHYCLELILKSSHSNYDRNKIALRDNKNDMRNRKRGGQKGHKGFIRKPPSKVNKIVKVPSVKTCLY